MRSILIASAVLTLAAAAPAAAGEPMVVEGRSAVPIAYVSYRDLNLAAAADVGQLNARVRRAAHGLCVENQATMARTMAGFACRSDAIAGAQPQIRAAIENAGNATLAANAAGPQRIAVRSR